MNSLVSVIIPVYNGSNFLEDAILSVLNQSYSNIEIIVINDGSNDNGLTKKVANKFKGKIKYFEKKNGGVASALNFGINKASGSFFCWLSHDDLFLKQKIESQIKIADEKSIIFSDFFISDELMKSLREIKINRNYISNMQFWLIRNKTLNGCTVMIPMTILRKYKFNESLLVSQDYDLWFRLSKHYKFRCISEKTVISRQHKLQHTNQHTIIEKNELESLYLKMVKSFFDNFLNKKNFGMAILQILLLLISLSRFGYFRSVFYLQKKILMMIIGKSFFYYLLIPFILFTYSIFLMRIYFFSFYRKFFTSEVKFFFSKFLMLQK